MSQPADVPPPPQPSYWAPAQLHEPRARRVGSIVTGLVVACLIAVCSAYPLALSIAEAQGAIDPEIRRSATYTLEAGPSSPILFDSRPDVIMQRYLADYVRLAGTFPCAQTPFFYDWTKDPVLRGKPCPVNRPVASFAITSVTVVAQGFLNTPAARVHYLIRYADGSQYADEFWTWAHSAGGPWPLFSHLDCWSNFDLLYPDLVPDIPAGISYGRPGAYFCKDHAGHVLRR